MRNDPIPMIAQELLEADSVLIFPHILMDGDAMGSAAALCKALRAMDKDAYIVIEDKVPDYLMFLDHGYTVDVENIGAADIGEVDVSICVDCGEKTRFPKRAELFYHGETKICIDHHVSSVGIGDYNYIDPEAAATGEIIFDLLIEMGAEIDEEIADALFAAITTDTGNFQYSNTTAHSHEVAIALIDHGLDSSKVSVSLYEHESLSKMKLHSRLIEQSRLFADGEGILTICTQQMLKETGTLMEDTEGVVATLRTIHGVQISVFIKEQPDGSVKVSLRSKERGDVAAISQKYGGGGHVRAAGFNLSGITLEQAASLVIEEVTAALAEE
ncbi:MAG: bifunctional oligoribonuclease/PAP phosphatase NrnA [Firmicutes bacterium]|nr:bifunctional oligoribonuclease/PAP phosphatase NrnA [Bacillota bacterium]MBQ3964711.1 bifunctional oligoribonuclease/PAP phosphatase NrnA [Bacillota bacterium]